MQYKPSLYNNFVIHKKNIILFNSLSKAYAKSKNISVILEILKNPNENTENHLFEYLIRDGFIVENNLDEKSLADFEYLEKVCDKKLSLTILPTEQCNFRCNYCYESFDKDKMLKEVQESLVKWFKKNISTYEGVSISWFGGEPLLAMDAIEYLSENILDVCHKRGRPYSASITTNGSLLKLDTFRKLLSLRINTFQITLDGTKEYHNKMRPFANGQGSYETIVNNLKEIRDKIKSNTFKILIRTNITSENITEINLYLKEFIEEFGEDSRFIFYFRPTGNWGGEKVKEIKEKIIGNLDDIYEPIIESEYKLCYLPYIDFLNDGMCEAIKRNSYVLGSDGTVYKCTMLFEEEKNKIGKLLNDGNILIDKVKLSKWICYKEIPSECEECSTRPSCNKRTCPAKGYILNEQGKCGYENSSIDSVLKLLSESKYNGKEIIKSYDNGGKEND
ncbi:MAG: radical SAM protein [Cellulosilyticaceae bacterium]